MCVNTAAICNTGYFNPHNVITVQYTGINGLTEIMPIIDVSHIAQ